MKPRGLLFIVFAVLVVTALSAAVAAAQNVPQTTQSGDLAMPTDVTGSSPVNITNNFDTGNTQISTHMPGETNTNSTPQRQPRERRDRSNDGAAPAGADPGSGNPTNPGPRNASGGALTELPRTGGPGV